MEHLSNPYKEGVNYLFWLHTDMLSFLQCIKKVHSLNCSNGHNAKYKAVEKSEKVR